MVYHRRLLLRDRRNLRSERSDYVRPHESICWKTRLSNAVAQHWRCRDHGVDNFIRHPRNHRNCRVDDALDPIARHFLTNWLFVILGISAHWPARCDRCYDDPVRKIRPEPHGSAYKITNLISGETNKQRTKRRHKLFRRRCTDTGRSRDAHSASQFSTTRSCRSSPLILNCHVDVRCARQLPKTRDQRRTQLLLNIDFHRVLQSHRDWIVSYFLTSHDEQALTHAIQADPCGSFEYRKFYNSARCNISHYGGAGNRRRHRTHLNLRAAGFLWHIQQELSAAQFDRSPATDVVNRFLAQTRDRLVSERQLTARLGSGLHRITLRNRLIDRYRARRRT